MMKVWHGRVKLRRNQFGGIKFEKFIQDKISVLDELSLAK